MSQLHGHDASIRGLGASQPSLQVGGVFSHAQNRAILVTSLSCACISLMAAVVALRWFLLMRRTFRHHLVLFLIASDTFKAIWYFVFPIIVFAAGPIESTSAFCQASGFLLLFSVEASDFAILLIAIHAIMYIFVPTSKTGEGGLYPYRRWMIPCWLGPPLLAACLAFVNENTAYVSSGTFCYLPKRPFWYRLALSWIPRYLIVSTIFLMYASIYVYVHFKFRGFINLGAGHSSYDQESMSRNSIIFFPMAEQPSGSIPAKPTKPLPAKISPASALFGSSNKSTGNAEIPWDSIDFITSRPLGEHKVASKPEFDSEDFARPAGSAGSAETRVQPRPMSIVLEVDESSGASSRKPSEVPTINTSYTGDTAATSSSINPTATAAADCDGETVDALRNTRLAIRRQLRLLFIYPLIYVVMWAFPFASHVLNYSDYFVQHPPFWLNVVQTVMLALQAGVDCVVFSWREKPWRRIDDTSRCSLPFIRRQSRDFLRRLSERGSVDLSSSPAVVEEPTAPPPPVSSPQWWEAEGRLRKDSVWMGTDAFSLTTSRRGRSGSRTPTSSKRPLT